MDYSLVLAEFAKQIGRPIDTACRLIENILGVPSTKLGDLLGDHISYWQWSNRLCIVEKATQKLQDSPARQLPLDFAVPFLRECGDASDPNLQEWWAEMLASAINDESFQHVAFVNTLKSMSAADVRFVDSLLKTAHAEREGRIEAVAEAAGLSISQTRISFHNLESLGFFSPTATRLKGFAFDFIKACCPNRELIEAYKEKQSQMGRAIVLD